MSRSRKVLNVGGGGGRQVPDSFRGWEQVVLDIDPAAKPDIVLDARRMTALPPSEYDAVYCSHTLEHFYEQEVGLVLYGFQHVLKPDGFAHVKVPNLQVVFDALASGKSLDNVWYYASGNVPVFYRDAIYGWSHMMRMGNTYFSHKFGFTSDTLAAAMKRAGFPTVYVDAGETELRSWAFRREPSKQQLRAVA